MAKRTRPRSVSPRERAGRFFGDPRIGAAEAAPTAPHATAPLAGDTSSGPARFWRGRGVQIAVVLTVALSLGVHVYLVWPEGSGIEFKDVDGELTIPVELLGEEAPPEEPPPPPPAPASAESDPDGVKHKADAAPPPKPKPDAALDAEALSRIDAGDLARLDAGAAATDQASDAGREDGSVEDGSPDAAVSDAGERDAAADGGGVALADASAPSAPTGPGPRDPGAIIGLPGLISAGTVNVTLIVNVAVIRSHPVGARMGPLLTGIPQWRDFLKGSQADPIRDTDWILIYGPSLIHTERDAVIVHYSIGDDVVDKAVESIVKRYDKGSAFDAGVPGVKASLGHADNAERVFLRGQPHVLTIVPKDKANDFAKLMKRSSIQPKVRPGEAVRLIVKDPWKQISIPGLKFAESLKELRLWVVPRTSDGGADVYVEGDCTSEAAAVDNADALTTLVKHTNNLGVRFATSGLLNHARVEADGTHIRMHVSASPQQLEAILQGAGALLGATIAPASGAGSSP